jgi:hypothetical protein
MYFVYLGMIAFITYKQFLELETRFEAQNLVQNSDSHPTATTGRIATSHPESFSTGDIGQAFCKYIYSVY